MNLLRLGYFINDQNIACIVTACFKERFTIDRHAKSLSAAFVATVLAPNYLKPLPVHQMVKQNRILVKSLT